LTARERRLLLAILGFLTFSSVYTNIVISPVITQLAAEFGVTTGTAGLVAAAYGAPGILIAGRIRIASGANDSSSAAR